LRMRFGGWAGVLAPLLTWQLRPRLGVSASELRPIEKVEAISSAKLFVAGSEDEHTTLEESQHLFAAASEPKQLWIVKGAHHQDLYRFAPKEYEQRILEFLECTLTH